MLKEEEEDEVMGNNSKYSNWLKVHSIEQLSKDAKRRHSMEVVA